MCSLVDNIALVDWTVSRVFSIISKFLISFSFYLTLIFDCVVCVSDGTLFILNFVDYYCLRLGLILNGYIS
jgi:hypothetical protein